MEEIRKIAEFLQEKGVDKDLSAQDLQVLGSLLESLEDNYLDQLKEDYRQALEDALDEYECQHD